MNPDGIYTPEVRAAFPAPGVQTHPPVPRATRLDDRTTDAVEDALMVIEGAAAALSEPGPVLPNIQRDILARVTFIRDQLGLS